MLNQNPEVGGGSKDPFIGTQDRIDDSVGLLVPLRLKRDFLKSRVGKIIFGTGAFLVCVTGATFFLERAEVQAQKPTISQSSVLEPKVFLPEVSKGYNNPKRCIDEQIAELGSTCRFEE